MAVKREPLDHDDIRQIVRREIDAAESVAEQNSAQRQKNLDYYRGVNLWASKPGQSSMVTRETMETIEWIMPQLVKVFASTEEIVKFDPFGPEDEQAADQATDYCSYIWNKDNNGFLNLHTFLKSSLLDGLGVLKIWFEETPKTISETFANLSEPQLMLLMQEEGVEITAAEPVPGAPGPDGQPTQLYNVQLSWQEPEGRVRIMPVPGEEYLYLASVRSDTDPGQGHRRRMTHADLVAQGYDPDLVDTLPTADQEDTWGERAHRQDTNMLDTITRDSRDRASREIEVVEWFTKLAVDGSDNAKWQKVTLGGHNDSVLLDIEECDGSPFAVISPVLMPHRLLGLSIPDLVNDLQELKTSITRQMLNSLYLANNPRTWAVADQVNIDELLSSQPGGVVRVRQPGMIGELNTQFVGSQAFPMLEYADRLLESRSGVSKISQGIDPDILKGGGQQTATGVAAMESAAKQRIELIARVCAETGLKRCFKLMLKLITKYQNQSRTVRLRNQWVDIDPRNFNDEMDMTAQVGLGTGSKMEQLGYLSQILAGQKEALMQGLPICTPAHLYATYSRMVELSGLKNPETYFQDPAKLPPQPPGPPAPDPNMAMVEMQGQVEAAKLQLEREKMQRADDRARDQMEIDFALKQAELQARYGAQLNVAAVRAQVDRDREIIKQQAQIAQAQMQPQQPPGPPQGMPPNGVMQ